MTKEEALRILDWIPTKGDEVDALEMAIEALEKKPVIVIQLDVLMSPNTILRFRDDMLKQMKDGLVVIPGFAHLAYVGEGCDIQIVEKGE